MVWNDGMEFTKADTSREGMEKRAGPYFPAYLAGYKERYYDGYPRADTKYVGLVRGPRREQAQGIGGTESLRRKSLHNNNTDQQARLVEQHFCNGI